MTATYANQAAGLRSLATLRNCAAAGLVLLAAGCSTIASTDNTQHHNQWAYTSAAIAYLPATASAQLGDARPGSRIVIEESPWGKHATVFVQDRFFAASGKPCLAATIETSASQPIAANLCEYADQRWGSTRALQIQALPDRDTGGSQP